MEINKRSQALPSSYCILKASWIGTHLAGIDVLSVSHVVKQFMLQTKHIVCDILPSYFYDLGAEQQKIH